MTLQREIDTHTTRARQFIKYCRNHRLNGCRDLSLNALESAGDERAELAKILRDRAETEHAKLGARIWASKNRRRDDGID